MNEEEQNDSIEAREISKPVVFVRGFLLRFMVGLVPMGLIAVIRPDLRTVILLAIAWFFVVCILGGASDVVLKRAVRLDRRLIRLTPRVLVILALLVVSFIYLYATR